MSATMQSAVLKGGEWIAKESVPAETFAPEDLTEEQRMIMEMCTQFLDSEVVPVYDRVEKLEPGLMQSLLQKAGEQGLLATAFPESYGGLGKDFITSTIVNEALGGG